MWIASFEIDSPLGPLFAAATEKGLCALAFADSLERTQQHLARRFGAEAKPGKGAIKGAIVEAIRAYFAGQIDALDRIAVDVAGTAFQSRVWSELRKVPAGKTVSYGDIARAIGKPSAVRAVGAANGQNPVVIAVPCHRIVASDGSLHGYGGGLRRKRWLLEHEGAIGRRLFSP